MFDNIFVKNRRSTFQQKIRLSWYEHEFRIDIFSKLEKSD